MPKVKVDGIEVEVPQGATVLQACEAAGKKFQDFVITKDYLSLVIAECV